MIAIIMVLLHKDSVGPHNNIVHIHTAITDCGGKDFNLNQLKLFLIRASSVARYLSTWIHTPLGSKKCYTHEIFLLLHYAFPARCWFASAALGIV